MEVGWLLTLPVCRVDLLCGRVTWIMVDTWNRVDTPLRYSKKENMIISGFYVILLLFYVLFLTLLVWIVFRYVTVRQVRVSRTVHRHTPSRVTPHIVTPS